MPSHLQDKMSADSDFQLPSFVSLNDVKGNQWADDLAGQSATSHELPLNITTPYIYHKNLIKRIQKRLTVILCSLPNRPKHIPKVKVPSDSFDTCCNLSRHVIYDVDHKHIGCARCKQVRNKSNVGIRLWLGSDCQPREASWDRPIPLVNEFVQIGKLSIHHTHKVYSFKNIYYCIKCGSYASNKLRKLAAECKPRTSAGQLFLDKLNKGILPPHTSDLSNQLEIAALLSIQNYVDNNAIAPISPISEAEDTELESSNNINLPSSPGLVQSDSD